MRGGGVEGDLTPFLRYCFVTGLKFSSMQAELNSIKLDPTEACVASGGAVQPHLLDHRLQGHAQTGHQVQQPRVGVFR